MPFYLKFMTSRDMGDVNNSNCDISTYSLMRDQVETFCARGMAAGSVTHDSSHRERENMTEGKYKLLFIPSQPSVELETYIAE